MEIVIPDPSLVVLVGADAPRPTETFPAYPAWSDLHGLMVRYEPADVAHVVSAVYWAQALARRDNSTALSARFKPLAKTLEENEATIDAELIAAQGKPVDTGGYYLPEQAKTSAAMRPSATLNAALAAL